METPSSVSPCFTVVNADRGPVLADDELGVAAGGGFRLDVGSAVASASSFAAMSEGRVSRGDVEGVGSGGGSGEATFSKGVAVASGGGTSWLVDGSAGGIVGPVAGSGSARTTEGEVGVSSGRFETA